jgi:hypothetical protein
LRRARPASGSIYGIMTIAVGSGVGASEIVTPLWALRLRSPLDVARGDPEPVEGSGQAGPSIRSPEAA